MSAPRNVFSFFITFWYQALEVMTVIWTSMMLMMMMVAVGNLNLNLNVKGKSLSLLLWYAIQRKNKSLRIVQVYLS